MTRYLGCDVGTKTIGLATSDRLGMIATPLITLRRSKLMKDIEALQRIITDEAIDGLVIGLPLNMDGSEGPRAQSIRSFAASLAKAFPALDIHFWDERLSTMAVERVMLDADISRAKRAAYVDKLAASYILQGFLDAQSHHSAHT